MKNSEEKIFKQRNCLTLDELKAYHDNQLVGENKHMVEQHLVDCEMCSDSLEALSNYGIDKIDQINKNVSQRLSDSSASKNRSLVLPIAASIAILLAAGSIYYFSNNNNSNKHLTDNKNAVRDTIIQMTEVKNNKYLAPSKPSDTLVIPIPDQTKRKQNLIVQVAEIDSTNDVVYYDSIEIIAQPLLADAVIAEVDPIADDVTDNLNILASPSSDTTIGALQPLELQERKLTRNRRRNQYAYGELGSKTTTVALFPGGDEKLVLFIEEKQKEFNYQDKGKVVVVFHVSKLGKIEKVKIKRSRSEVLSKLALDIVNDMPDWAPALKKSKAIGSIQKLVLTF